MSLITLNNDKLFLEISPQMGASITKFKSLKSGRDIFRPFPNKKKITKKNCYFAGYFPTVPYFGEIKKKTFLYKQKYIDHHFPHFVARWRLATNSLTKLQSSTKIFKFRTNNNRFSSDIKTEQKV